MRNVAIVVAIILIGLLIVVALSRRSVQQFFIPSPTPTTIIVPTTPTTPTPAPTISITVTPSATSTPTQATPTPRQSNNIRVSSPALNQVVTSPLRLSGQARGSWFFEAQAPVRLIDANGQTLAEEPITAQGDWQTNNFVPFIGELNFSNPVTSTGQLIFQNSNPSGLQQNSQQFIVTIRFR